MSNRQCYSCKSGQKQGLKKNPRLMPHFDLNIKCYGFLYVMCIMSF